MKKRDMAERNVREGHASRGQAVQAFRPLWIDCIQSLPWPPANPSILRLKGDKNALTYVCKCFHSALL